jgi:hypothetical protein
MLRPEIGVEVVLLPREVAHELWDAEGFVGKEHATHEVTSALQDAGYERVFSGERGGRGGAVRDESVGAAGAGYEGEREVGGARMAVRRCER